MVSVVPIDFLSSWICTDKIEEINFYNYLYNDNRVNQTKQDFANGSNGGILSGVIGALNGWLVKIAKPSCTKDKVVNPGHYYSRKGHHVVNVEAIVDKKRIIWRPINNC